MKRTYTIGTWGDDCCIPDSPSEDNGVKAIIFRKECDDSIDFMEVEYISLKILRLVTSFPG